MKRALFTDRVLVVAGVAIVALLAWQLSAAFTLMFGGLVFATLLLTIAHPLERSLGVAHRGSVAIAVLAVVVLLGLTGWLVGDRLASQVDTLRERLPAAIDATMQWLRSHDIGRQLIASLSSTFDEGMPWLRLGTAASLTLGALGNLGLMVVLGIYLAANPGLYRRGLCRLVAPRHRERLADSIAASGEGLSKWLMGQAVSMVFVGSATAIGLALLGMPLALTLGLIAGLLGFVPFFGPIASGLLATLLAFTEGPSRAMSVAMLAIGIQWIEGNLLMPFVQRRAVALPPVLGLMAVVVFGGLFGLTGVLFATPMMVVLMILVQRVYVDGVLESDAEPGEVPGSPLIAASSVSPATGLTRKISNPAASA